MTMTLIKIINKTMILTAIFHRQNNLNYMVFGLHKNYLRAYDLIQNPEAFLGYF